MRLTCAFLLAFCTVACGNADAALRADLYEMRKAIDGYYADSKHYPQHLSTLVPKYLRQVPVDPITRSASTWIEVHDNGGGVVVDVLSGAEGNARVGTAESAHRRRKVHQHSGGREGAWPQQSLAAAHRPGGLTSRPMAQAGKPALHVGSLKGGGAPTPER